MKEKIYILHGWAYNTLKWKVFLNEVKEYNLLDIPGLTAPLKKPWTLDDYVAWLDKKISKPIILLGHSNGGRIATAYAAKYPKKVKKLILIDSAGIRFFSLKRTIFRVIAKIGKTITSSNKLKEILYKISRERDYLEASSIMKKTMANLISIDLTTLLYSIRVPTLIIWGEYDKITPLRDAHVLHKNIPNSTLKIIKGARHSPFFTHPKQVAQLIHEYI